MSNDAPDPIDLHRLRALAERAVDAALAAGGQSADAVALTSSALSATVRNGVVEEAESAEATDLGLRVFVGQRSALVGVSPKADLAEAAARAVAMAKAAPEDETQGLPDPALLATAIDADALDIADAARPRMDELTDRAHRLEHAMLKVPGVTNSGGAFASATRAGRWLATSGGFSAGYLTSRHAHSGTAVAGEGTRMERDSWSSVRRHLADLADIAAVGRIAAERAVRKMDAERLTTRTATIVFEPRAASGFVGHLLQAVNGSAVARGASLLAGKLGAKVLADGITIRDDPSLVRGLASRPFDGEGLGCGPLDIVADGVLAAYVLDLATARKLALDPNGRAGRGTGSPAPTTTNVTVHGGSGTMEDLLKDAGTGLLVTDLIGMGANIVNGSYSRGAAGFWFEGGEIVHPVSEITIAGHLADMFARARFADDAPGLYIVDAPSVAIEGLTIGGR
ncbi:TldD/PmbA family protein [Acuticoccus mangrovi]|uniref:TldD/PmbA family protein n=1 Tax=Acuticoccus mangrovi TaxID=2796142 RepID=A0A934MHI3_9HYPH|nr:metallopeptidase TldD-related protein [Acuticoccus mangrovi]MBJ3777688.1 TldD/PmbA family protein [Acuticoccus mangrovi]